MAKVYITKEDREEVKKTRNGAIKKIWCFAGGLICFVATILISLLIIYSSHLTRLSFYLILYALLVIVVLGGEMIGTYYGALEQYMINKKEKKQIDFKE